MCEVLKTGMRSTTTYLERLIKVVQGFNKFPRQYPLKEPHKPWDGQVLYVFMCQLLSHVQLFETPIDYSPPSSSVTELLQVRILEWVATLFSRIFSQPRDQTLVSYIAGWLFITWATMETLNDFICLY